MRISPYYIKYDLLANVAGEGREFGQSVRCFGWDLGGPWKVVASLQAFHLRSQPANRPSCPSEIFCLPSFCSSTTRNSDRWQQYVIHCTERKAQRRRCDSKIDGMTQTSLLFSHSALIPSKTREENRQRFIQFVFFLLEKWSKTLLFFNALLLSAFVLRCCVKFIKLLLQSMWLPSDVYDHLPNHLYSEDWNNTNEPVLCDLPKNVSVALFKSVSRF